MREHLVASFDEALERADRLISDMGDLAGKMVAAATYALLTSDVALAERVIADDAAMDAKQREIDERAITADRHATTDGAGSARHPQCYPHGRRS